MLSSKNKMFSLGEQLPTGIDILKHLKARLSEQPEGSKMSKQKLLSCTSARTIDCKEACGCILSELKKKHG